MKRDSKHRGLGNPNGPHLPVPSIPRSDALAGSMKGHQIGSGVKGSAQYRHPKSHMAMGMARKKPMQTSASAGGHAKNGISTGKMRGSQAKQS